MMLGLHRYHHQNSAASASSIAAAAAKSRQKNPFFPGISHRPQDSQQGEHDADQRQSHGDGQKSDEHRFDAVDEAFQRLISIGAQPSGQLCHGFLQKKLTQMSQLHHYFIASNMFIAILFITGTHTEFPACLYNRPSL